MTRKTLRALFSFSLLLSASYAQAAECHYTLTAARALQCRPIKLVENEDQKPLWTYVENSARDGVVAHILCACDTAAASFQPLCEAPQTHKLTFTTETKDIRDTCAQATTLCQAPCQQLINH